MIFKDYSLLYKNYNSYHLFFLTLFLTLCNLFSQNRKPYFDCPCPQIIAHQGSSLELPPNTVEAFQLALKQGADIIELDIWRTEDGEWVVVHDENLLKITGINKNVGELNTITLSKIKGIYEKFIEKENINKAIESNAQPKSSDYSLENEFSDETMINLKLKELEKKRSIIPVYEEATQLETFESDINTKHTPSVSFTLQPNISQKSLYKSMVFNSATRDWIKYPYINGFQKQIDINTKNYLLFPGNLILPHFISMTTPFIKLKISNDMQSNMYIFTLFQENSLWDVWKTCDDIENILLDSGIWKLTIFDLYDNEIQIGNDAINIDEVAVLSNNNLKIKLNTED